MRTVDLVLMGGGIRGVFQARVLLALAHAGYQFRRIIGTSVGAIVAAGLRIMSADKVVERIEALKESDVLRKNPEWWALLQLTKHTGMYSWYPLRDLLRAEFKDIVFPETWVTLFNTITRDVDTVPATAQSVYLSALMPLIGRFDQFCDGGLRAQIPLGEGLDIGIGADGVPVVIVMTQPVREQPGAFPIPHDGPRAIETVISGTLREVAYTDLWPFMWINYACKINGGTFPRADGGTDYRYFPFELYAPWTALPPALAFGDAKATDIMRKEAEACVIRGPLTTPESVLTWKAA